MTIAELLKAGERRLLDAGIGEAKTDAYLLLRYLTEKDRTFIFAHGDSEVSRADELTYREWLAKRSEHVPLQHIVGETEFMGLPFYSNPMALIPRIDTEFLVEEILKQLPDGAKVLDLCTGSGCILLSLMCYKKGIEGTASDISGKAIDLARMNEARLRRLGRLDGKITYCRCDLFEEIGGTYDLIVSNPPYIRTSEIETLMEEVRVYEPRIALDGSEDGLYFYREIAEKAGDHLNREGRIFLEIGAGQGRDVKEILESKGYRDVEIKRDYAGNERVASCLNR